MTNTTTTNTTTTPHYGADQTGHTGIPGPYLRRRQSVLPSEFLLPKFAEHQVVLPIVINELEAKRQHPELGWFARQALGLLEDFRRTTGRLDEEIEVTPEGGTLRVELNHIDESVLPAGLRDRDIRATDGTDNDRRILATAINLRSEGHHVTLVTKDVPLRVKAGSVGLDADEYRAQDVVLTGYEGMVTAEVPTQVIDDLFAEGAVDGAGVVDDVMDLPVHCGVQLSAGSQSALARVAPHGVLRQVPQEREAFGLRGRSARQRVALDLLLDEDIGIVSLGGSAGTGKSALALCAGLEAVLERGSHRRIVVFRPLYAVGGQDLGYLPGDENDRRTRGPRRPTTPRRPGQRERPMRSTTAGCWRCCR